jgi:hypothetical protein
MARLPRRARSPATPASRTAAGRRAALHIIRFTEDRPEPATGASATRGVERSHCLRAPEHQRPGGGHCDRRVAAPQMHDIAYFPIVVTILAARGLGPARA